VGRLICAGECSRCRATRASEETDERPLHTMHARGRPDVRERWRKLSGAARRRHAPGGAERVRSASPERHERGTGLEPRGPHLYPWVDHAQLDKRAQCGRRWLDGILTSENESCSQSSGEEARGELLTKVGARRSASCMSSSQDLMFFT